MWLVVYLSMLSLTLKFSRNIFDDFQNSGGAVKKVLNAFKKILFASTQHSFAMATSIVLMAVTKDLVVG